LSAAQAAQQADRLERQMAKVIDPPKTHADNERFAKHLRKHTSQLFTFLRQEGVDATNHRAEQAIRPAVVNRKVWGGNRTWAGAQAQSILMSVLGTCRQRGRQVLDYVSSVLRRGGPHLPPGPSG
jgi:transposase